MAAIRVARDPARGEHPVLLLRLRSRRDRLRVLLLGRDSSDFGQGSSDVMRLVLRHGRGGLGDRLSNFKLQARIRYRSGHRGGRHRCGRGDGRRTDDRAP